MANGDKPSAGETYANNESDEELDSVMDFVRFCGVDENLGGIEKLSRDTLESLCHVLFIGYDTGKQYEHEARELIATGQHFAIEQAEGLKQIVEFVYFAQRTFAEMRAMIEQANETIRGKNSLVRELGTVLDSSIKELNKLDGIIKNNARKKTEIVTNAAIARHAPKQAAKTEIKTLWLEWQEKPYQFKSKADFARYAQSLHKDKDRNGESLIKDPKTITDRWIKEWESE